MYKDFDYEKSIEKIKSALFDIYENQEIIIGSITDESKRENHVNSYIEVKNKATNLIESINNLYQIEEKVMNHVENNVEKKQEEVVETESESEPELIEQGVVEQKNISEESINDPLEKTSTEVEIEDDKNLEKFYLDDSGNQPNFAYVSEEIYNKLKNNGKIVDTNIYKIDKEKKKGIIVRTDQFMKLSLSRHRQEGVLKEAKVFRIEQAKKSRERLKQEIA